MRFLLCFTALFLAACNETQFKQTLPQVPLEKLEKTGFAEIRNDVLATNCLECHKWTNDYQTVKKRGLAIRAAVLSGRMPKNRPFNLDQKALLIAWLDMGAPEFPGSLNPKPDPDPKVPTPVNGAELSYLEVHETIFSAYCLDCHTEATVDNDFTTLNSYAEVKHELERMQKMIAEKKMPPQKAEFPLPDDLRKTLLEWIEAGGPEFNSKDKGGI